MNQDIQGEIARAERAVRDADTLALIPARTGSKGISGKNFRTLGGKPLYRYAVECAIQAGGVPILSSDLPSLAYDIFYSPDRGVDFHAMTLLRPPGLAQDDTPMLAVVKHALAQIPGPPDQVIVLLQPTQPLRTPAHVRAAICLLRETRADSVVSVVELPLTHSPDLVLSIDGVCLYPYTMGDASDYVCYLGDQVTCRQEAETVYRRDGTCYAFTRATVEQYGDIYGEDCRPLIVDPNDSCELDTEADWIALERRWKERYGAA